MYIGIDLDDSNSAPSETSLSFTPVPDAWYPVIITQANIEDKQNGSMLNVWYRIDGPSFNGRVLFDRIWVTHATPDAERIGREQIGELRRAACIERLTDTDQLSNKQLEVKTKIESRDGHPDQNKIVARRGFSSQMVAVPKSVAPRPPASKPEILSTDTVDKPIAPWKRNKTA